MPDSFKILITGAATTAALGVLKGLRMGGDPSLHVVMGDLSPECAGAHLGDEFVVLPDAERDDFGERAVELCRRLHIDLVIPINDRELFGWSDVRSQLSDSGTQVVVSSRPALERCREKDRTRELFERVDVPTIPTWRDDAVDPARLPFPVHLKPRSGHGSIDNHRADTLDELRVLLRKVPDPLVQPFVHGQEVTIDCLSDLSGRFLAASPRLRLQIKSGQSVRSRTFRDAALEAHAKRIVAALGLVGPSNVQCFLTDAGPRFLEVNARFGSGSILSMHAGLNGPRALVAMARRQPLPPLEPRAGLTMLRYWQEVIV